MKKEIKIKIILHQIWFIILNNIKYQKNETNLRITEINYKKLCNKLLGVIINNKKKF